MMTQFDTNYPTRGLTGCGLATICALALMGCSDPMETSTNATGSTSNTTSTAGETDPSGTDPASSDTSEESTDSSGTESDSETGTETETETEAMDACPDADGYNCAQEPECDGCGIGTSRSDAMGCPRPECTGGCPEGMACLEPFLWGGCGPGVPNCNDQKPFGSDELMCLCYPDLSCENSWCVPNEALEETFSGPARVLSYCQDSESIYTRIVIGLEETSCGAQLDAQAWIELDVVESPPLVAGEYLVAAARYHHQGATLDIKTYGAITIDTWQDGVVTGTYVVGFRNLHRTGEFVAAIFCDENLGCE